MDIHINVRTYICASNTFPHIDLESSKFKISKSIGLNTKHSGTNHLEVSITYFLNPMNHYVGEYSSCTYYKGVQVLVDQSFLSFSL